MLDTQSTVVDGVVVENLPNTLFRVKLKNEQLVLGYLAGKMKRNYIRLLPGDKVKIEFTPYDSARGRIILKVK